MSNCDAADGCIISKANEDYDASSQAATQPSDYLSESLTCDHENSYVDEDAVSCPL